MRLPCGKQYFSIPGYTATRLCLPLESSSVAKDRILASKLPTPMIKALITFLHQLMSLPYLRYEHIQPVFYRLAVNAVTPEFQEVYNYILHTCLLNPLWPISSWSAFRRSICISNDAEGWHCHLNTHAKKSSLPLYVLIQLLYKEAINTSSEVYLVSEKKLRCRQTHTRIYMDAYVRFGMNMDNGLKEWQLAVESLCSTGSNSFNIDQT